MPIPPRARARAPPEASARGAGCAEEEVTDGVEGPDGGVLRGVRDPCSGDDGAGVGAAASVEPVEPVERGAGFGAVAGTVAGRPGGPCGSDVWRWSTGISAGRPVAGADGTTPAGPSAPAGRAPAGISRRGRPRAGRTAPAAGRPPSRPGDGASPSASARSGPLPRSDPARWTAGAAAPADGPAAEEEAAGADTDAEAGAAGGAGTSPLIRRSGIAGRRATISGGAIRRGRTAAGARTPEDT
ncbi:hypothetical protein ACFXMR_36780, partial [Streptomyces griseus]